MENKFFIPNNIKFPYSRKLLEEKIYFKLFFNFFAISKAK